MSAKRDDILAAATERFGRDGYEDTKWADIAGDVGVGPTALYHYFESKQHCVYVIMEQALESFGTRFAHITAAGDNPVETLIAVIDDVFDVDDHDVQRIRVLVAEQGLLAGPSGSPREEEARVAARARTRALELAWAAFLGDAMQRGAIPHERPAPHDARDPRPLQQHLALVPAERARRAGPRRGVLHRPQPRDARRDA